MSQGFPANNLIFCDRCGEKIEEGTGRRTRNNAYCQKHSGKYGAPMYKTLAGIDHLPGCLGVIEGKPLATRIAPKRSGFSPSGGFHDF